MYRETDGCVDTEKLSGACTHCYGTAVIIIACNYNDHLKIKVSGTVDLLDKGGQNPTSFVFMTSSGLSTKSRYYRSPCDLSTVP
jgi:hypothetical protein